jgi:hypothetical protein
MAKSLVEFPITSVEDVLKVPFNIVKYNVLKPLMDIDVKMFLALSLVLLFLSFLMTEWKSSPKSCKEMEGACFKIFKGQELPLPAQGSNDTGSAGVYVLLRTGLQILVALLYFKIVARGVQAHGIKPIAFLNLAAVAGIAEVSHVFLNKLFKVSEVTGFLFATDEPGQQSSFQSLCQQYIYYVNDVFRIDSIENTFNFSAVFFGVVAGILAA